MGNNDCKNIFALIHKKINDTITPDEKHLLEEHIDRCFSCKKQLAVLEKTILLLNEHKVAPSADFTENIMAMTDGYDKKLVLKPVKAPVLISRLRWVPVMAMSIFFIVSSVFLVNKMISKPKIVKINFTFEMPEAQTVSLVGEFNDWEPEANILTRKDGFWTIELPLKPGRYQYAFVVDGSKWLPDPKAKELIDNGYGSKNSVIDTLKL